MTDIRPAIAAILIVLVCCCGVLLSCNDAQDTDGTGAAAGAPQLDSGQDATPGMQEPAAESAGNEQEAGAAPEVGSEGEEQAEMAAAGDGESSLYVSAEDVYKSANCEMCHGKKLQGSRLAPPLEGLSQYWDRESLAEYLVDPVAYTENDDRLKTNFKQYTLPMPAWKQTGLEEKDMYLLIDWLLEQE